MRSVSLLACALFAGAPILNAEEPRRPFQPNYISVQATPLVSANGGIVGNLQEGTLVEARPTAKVLLQVRTEDGRAGQAPRRFFSRLGSSIPITEEARSAARSNNQFAVDLYKRAQSSEGNLFFSPASISTALAMTYAGAGGQTKEDMEAVLHFSAGQNVHGGYATLLELLNSTGFRNGYSVSTANRLWSVRGYAFEQPFLDLTRQKYLAELKTVDFHQPEKARQEINGWVADQTRKKITDLIPPGVLTPETRLVLTNAIYFLGGWADEFSKSATKPAPFHVSASEMKEVPTMAQTDEFPYTEDADAQVLALPYRGGELSMVIILPRRKDGLAAVEAGLTEPKLEAWLEALSGRLAEVYLPKFQMRTTFLLSGMLKAMGMASAFSPDADFSAMSRKESLMISEVIHQAFVDVDEKGTEAAAATAVIMPTAAAPGEAEEPPKPVIFRADHPFLFLIRDNRDGAILFMGRLNEPGQ